MKYKPYDPAELERLKLMLEAEAKEGHPLYFEVKVDDHVRIHRTNKVERFDDIHNFINEDTEKLIITTSPDPEMRRKDWNKFTMGNHSMNGVDVDAKVEEKLRVFKEKMAAEKIQSELTETKDKLEQAEAYIDTLLSQLEEAKIKPNHIGELDLGKLASSTIEGIAIHYPKVFEKVPVLNGIAKTIQEGSGSKHTPQNNSLNGQVSFTPLTESKEQSEHEETVKRLSEFIAEHFDDNQKQLLGAVIVALGENPSQLQTVAELLEIDPNQTETE